MFEFQKAVYNVSVFGDSTLNETKLVRSDRVSMANAKYISIHFAQFSLPSGHYVKVSSEMDTRISYVLDGTKELAFSENGFYGAKIDGDTAIVEYYAMNRRRFISKQVGYRIDGFRYDSEAQVELESFCGKDRSLNAICLANKAKHHQLAYGNTRAVARLVIEGKNYCTGFLLGKGGYLMTNWHCISSQREAENTNFEFNAEGSRCESKCDRKMACPGNIVATNATIVAFNRKLDYTLVKLHPIGTMDVNKMYGSLKLRAEKPRIGERIYIPQHPHGHGKRVALYLEDDSHAKVKTTSIKNACGDQQVGYMAGTSRGSSGSPVIAMSDHKVVALHHCDGCPNTGHQMARIVQDLKKEHALPPQCL